MTSRSKVAIGGDKALDGFIGHVTTFFAGKTKTNIERYLHLFQVFEMWSITWNVLLMVTLILYMATYKCVVARSWLRS